MMAFSSSEYFRGRFDLLDLLFGLGLISSEVLDGLLLLDRGGGMSI